MESMYIGSVLVLLLMVNAGCITYSCYYSQNMKYKTVSMEDSDQDSGNELRNIPIHNRSLSFLSAISLLFIGVFTGVLIAGYSFKLFAAEPSEPVEPSEPADMIHDYPIFASDIMYKLNDVDPNKVLQGASFIIYENSWEFFRGSFKGDNKWRFDFVSMEGDDVFFKLDDLQINEYGSNWIGFHFHFNEYGRIVDLYDNKHVLPHSIQWARQELELNEDIIKTFMGSRIAEFFAQLSIKLKYIGYFSEELTQDDPLYSLHHLAKYFHKISESNYVDNTKWNDLNDEIIKAKDEIDSTVATSPRSRALISALPVIVGYAVDELYDSECWRADQCGGGNNDCVGNCGNGCNCWKSVGQCTDCKCHKGCAIHDFHCSCSGTWGGHEATWGCCVVIVFSNDWDCNSGYSGNDTSCNGVPGWVTSGL